MRNTFVLSTVVLAMFVAPAFAQSGSTPRDRQQPTVQSGASPAKQSPTSPAAKQPSTKTAGEAGASAADHQFVMDAAKGGMAEVELGKLAAEKATSSDVKQFAQKMSDEHGKANDELKSLAKDKNILLPTTLDPKYKAVRDRLSKLTGDEFDRAYMQEMLKDHRTDVNEFRRESKSGKDGDIKAWAAKTLPTLEGHLKQAQTTNRMVATSGTKKGATKGTAGAGKSGANPTDTPSGKTPAGTPSPSPEKK